MRARGWCALALLLLTAFPAAAGEAAAGEPMLLVHVTTRLDEQSDRTVLVFRMIAAGIKKGYRVALFFDADGVASLKTGRWFGGHSTPLDRTEIRGKERKDLGELLGTPGDSLPDIYGSMLHFLKGRGVKVLVSRRALELRNIGDGAYDHAAEAADEEQIVTLLAEAAMYAAY